MASRLSVSTLILRTPVADAELDLFDRHAPGGPQLPPYLLMMSCRSCGTLEEPVHHQVDPLGSRLWISMKPVHLQDRPVGLAENLYAPWLCRWQWPARPRPSLDELGGLLGIRHVLEAVPPAPWPSSIPPQTPIPFHGHALGVRRLNHLARHFDVVLEARLVLPSGNQRPSIMTLVKPGVDGRLAGLIAGCRDPGAGWSGSRGRSRWPRS